MVTQKTATITNGHHRRQRSPILSLALLLLGFSVCQWSLVTAAQVNTARWSRRHGRLDYSVMESSQPQRTSALEKVAHFIDWDAQAKLPPWLCPIKEGADQGVALVLGQSLRPDGQPPQVLVDRALEAKRLVDEKKVVKVIVSGGDPAGVGHTEAYEMAKVLANVGIPSEMVIQESQATTTAENAWFALRWLPMGTGQLYIITSDFHMPRATYVIKATLNYFYKMLEDAYRDDARWTSKTKLYPRLNVTQVVSRSFCGTNSSLNRDDDPDADIDFKSLSFRALNEVKNLGSGEAASAMYGAPLSNIMYIWPVQINVTEDPQNNANFQQAMAQVMNAAQSLCACRAPPENVSPLIPNPLLLPIATTFPEGKTSADWQQLIDECTQNISLF